jgi:hypothetical protein
MGSGLTLSGHCPTLPSARDVPTRLAPRRLVRLPSRPINLAKQVVFLDCLDNQSRASLRIL